MHFQDENTQQETLTSAKRVYFLSLIYQIEIKALFTQRKQ